MGVLKIRRGSGDLTEREAGVIEAGGKSFEVWLVDTNVLSEMLKTRGGLRSTVIQRSMSVPAVLGFSMWTLLELRKRPDLYAEFVELFSLVPFALLHSPGAILEQEKAAYPDPSGVSPVLAVFSFMMKDDFGDVTGFLEKAFSDSTVQDAESQWAETWRAESLEAMLSHRKNFPPGPNGYGPEDARRFVDLATLQNVMFSDPAWAKERLEGDDEIAVAAFPSLRMSLYTVFYRFYSERREPELQDVFDILIHACAPYVELVLTEGFQSEIMKKTARRDEQLRDLRGLALNEVRRW